MQDLDRAMEEIRAIRGQIARSTAFRGYGPGAHAVTGALALAVAAIEAARLPASDLATFLLVWIATAAVAITVIAIEAYHRACRLHDGLVASMLHSALEPFLPCLAAGGLLTLLVARSAPEAAWMLPGLWQILLSLGVFASLRALPRALFAVGVWYLAAGLAVLALAAADHRLGPWRMGIPFGVGQLAVAVILYRNDRGHHD